MSLFRAKERKIRRKFRLTLPYEVKNRNVEDANDLVANLIFIEYVSINAFKTFAEALKYPTDKAKPANP